MNAITSQLHGDRRQLRSSTSRTPLHEATRQTPFLSQLIEWSFSSCPTKTLALVVYMTHVLEDVPNTSRRVPSLCCSALLMHRVFKRRCLGDMLARGQTWFPVEREIVAGTNLVSEIDWPLFPQLSGDSAVGGLDETGKAVSNSLLTSSMGLGALVPQSVADTVVMPKIVSPRLLLGYRTWSKLLTI